MTHPPPELEFQAEDFERLRLTLREHLHDVIPEREREKIFSLIHDVKASAVEISNRLLAERLEKCQRAYGNAGKMRCCDCGHSWSERISTDTHTAYLLFPREIEK